ncbi:Exonuclease 1 [Cucumispora dikerogammari]|nr:Exonuclease 1 [Cucumispora dikerogammari]
MGITGLLPLLKPCITPISLKKFKNKTIGVDGHSWLYMLGTSIAYELYNNIETKKHVPILKNKLKIYKSLNIKLIFVFDGNPLPSKSVTHEIRAKKKDDLKLKITELLEKNLTNKATFLMKQCVSIKPFFINSVLNYLKSNNYEYIISPYETDAQLTYLQRIKYLDAILTEDSDFILYGCTNILFKANGDKADLFQRDKLHLVNNVFDTSKLIEICVLSGCDYLKNVSKVGLKTAIKLFSVYGSISEVAYHLRSKDFQVPSNYEEEFSRALNTFKYQVVFDPFLKKRVYLSSPEEDGKNMKNMEFVGSLEAEKVQHLGEGEVTMEEIDININKDE